MYQTVSSIQYCKFAPIIELAIRYWLSVSAFTIGYERCYTIKCW